MTDAQNESNGRAEIQVFALGGFQTNCMIVTDGPPEKGKGCLIVDCGYEPDDLLDAVESQGLVPQKVLLTHAHADHIAGLIELHRRLGPVPIWMHKGEEAWLNDPMLNLSAALGLSVTAPQPEGFLDEGDTVELDGLVFEVRFTPGHSPGSISFIHAPSKVRSLAIRCSMARSGGLTFPGRVSRRSPIRSAAGSIRLIRTRRCTRGTARAPRSVER